MNWKTHPVRFFVLLGFAILAVSAAGAIFALNPPRDGTAPEEKKVAGQVAAKAGDVVCYGYVDVENGITQLAPLQPGRVMEVMAKEGTTVNKDDILLKMDDALARHRLQEAKADLASAEAQVEQAKLMPKQHEAQLAQQRAVVEAAQKRVQAAENLAKYAWGSITGTRTKENSVRAEAAERQVEEAKAAVKVEQEKLRQLQLVKPQLSVARAEAEAAAKQAQVDQANYALQQCELKAPAKGKILQVRVNPGSVLSGQSSQPAILFAAYDEEYSPPIIRAEVEQEFADDLKEGKAVEVRDENIKDPAKKRVWKGKIKRISNGYALRRSSSPDTLRISNNDVSVLEFIIQLDPGQPELRMGQRMRVVVGKN